MRKWGTEIKDLLSNAEIFQMARTFIILKEKISSKDLDFSSLDEVEKLNFKESVDVAVKVIRFTLEGVVTKPTLEPACTTDFEEQTKKISSDSRRVIESAGITVTIRNPFARVNCSDCRYLDSADRSYPFCNHPKSFKRDYKTGEKEQMYASLVRDFSWCFRYKAKE